MRSYYRVPHTSSKGPTSWPKVGSLELPIFGAWYFEKAPFILFSIDVLASIAKEGLLQSTLDIFVDVNEVRQVNLSNKAFCQNGTAIKTTTRTYYHCQKVRDHVNILVWQSEAWSIPVVPSSQKKSIEPPNVSLLEKSQGAYSNLTSFQCLNGSSINRWITDFYIDLNVRGVPEDGDISRCHLLSSFSIFNAF